MVPINFCHGSNILDLERRWCLPIFPDASLVDHPFLWCLRWRLVGSSLICFNTFQYVLIYSILFMCLSLSTRQIILDDLDYSIIILYLHTLTVDIRSNSLGFFVRMTWWTCLEVLGWTVCGKPLGFFQRNMVENGGKNHGIPVRKIEST